jgi:hypothetical protein
MPTAAITSPAADAEATGASWEATSEGSAAFQKSRSQATLPVKKNSRDASQSSVACKSKYASNSNKDRDINNASNSRDTSKSMYVSNNRRQAGNIRAVTTAIEKPGTEGMPATASEPATADTPATEMMKIVTATAGIPIKAGKLTKTGMPSAAEAWARQ